MESCELNCEPSEVKKKTETETKQKSRQKINTLIKLFGSCAHTNYYAPSLLRNSILHFNRHNINFIAFRFNKFISLFVLQLQSRLFRLSLSLFFHMKEEEEKHEYLFIVVQRAY